MSETAKSPRPISLTIAAKRAGVTPETVARWCKKDRIGKQLRPKAPWRVDPLGLEIVIAGDPDALAAYHAREFNHGAILPYLADERRIIGRATGNGQ